MRWGKCLGILCCGKIGGPDAMRLWTAFRGKGRWIRRRKCTGVASGSEARPQKSLRGGVGCAGGSETCPTGGFETGELLASYRSRSVAGDQWLAPETNRKASSIVFTPAFDPSELVSIFEY